MNRIDFLVVTSISGPNPVLRSLAAGARENGVEFVVVGDTKSPPGFALENCRFLSLESQWELPFECARALPRGRYSRKNIGYLHAIRQGARLIAETDDDNFDLAGFWKPRTAGALARLPEASGWRNIYADFGRPEAWPRGLPLEYVLAEHRPAPDALSHVHAPIQQHLADDNPDVDAVYRLTRPLPIRFDKKPPLALPTGCWCPFNSQATFWFHQAFPLMYLPSHCSFRMTDIWRGLVAQRILWTCGWNLLFDAPNVRQERNDHSLLADFSLEVSGYLHNDRIRKTLEDLDLRDGIDSIPENLVRCYTKMETQGWIPSEERPLLDAWLEDIGSASGRRDLSWRLESIRIPASERSHPAESGFKTQIPLPVNARSPA